MQYIDIHQHRFKEYTFIVYNHARVKLRSRAVAARVAQHLLWACHDPFRELHFEPSQADKDTIRRAVGASKEDQVTLCLHDGEVIVF